ncbi:MAG TPA: YceI family protein [Thermoanaerobaculia bacterium]|nr:YceI family protein [Thermoanaerobaculia bacterium]
MHDRIRPAATAATLILALVAVAVAPALAAGSWSVDPAHSVVSFSVKHFFTPVKGSFQEADVTLVYDPADPNASRVSARIPVASVETGNDRRDVHLRSADWFEADAHPYMTFESSAVRAAGDGNLSARGTLTIKGVSREISLPIQLLGVQEIPEEMRPMIGASRVASFKAATTIDRNDFEVGVGSWAAATVVGDAVDIEILIEAHLK